MLPHATLALSKKTKPQPPKREAAGSTTSRDQNTSGECFLLGLTRVVKKFLHRFVVKAIKDLIGGLCGVVRDLLCSLYGIIRDLLVEFAKLSASFSVDLTTFSISFLK